MRANSAPAGSPTLSIAPQRSRRGFQSATLNRRNEWPCTKYVRSHREPTTTEISVAIAAPATPKGRCVSQPKIRNGARIMLRTTVKVWTTIPGLKFPVPRNDAPIATMPNWSASAGTNQRR